MAELIKIRDIFLEDGKVQVRVGSTVEDDTFYIMMEEDGCHVTEVYVDSKDLNRIIEAFKEVRDG